MRLTFSINETTSAASDGRFGILRGQMRLQGVIFDLDGTLGNTLPVCIRAFQTTFQQFLGRRYEAEEIAALFGPSEEGMIRGLVDRLDDAMATYLSAYERAHADCVAPFDGIPTALRLLQARGAELAVVTGKGPSSAAISMRFLGLDSVIRLVECGSPDGANKPESIRRVLDLWGFESRQVAYVGDTPYDMAAATAAGVVPLGAAWAETSTVQSARPGLALATFATVDDFISWIEREVEPLDRGTRSEGGALRQ